MAMMFFPFKKKKEKIMFATSFATSFGREKFSCDASVAHIRRKFHTKEKTGEVGRSCAGSYRDVKKAAKRAARRANKVSLLSDFESWIPADYRRANSWEII